MEHAYKDADGLGLSVADYILLKNEFGTTALTSDNTFRAVDMGIDVEDYLKFKEDTNKFASVKNAQGKVITSKQIQVWDYIDGLPLSDKEKDSYHLLAGYKESSLGDAPWNR